MSAGRRPDAGLAAGSGAAAAGTDPGRRGPSSGRRGPGAERTAESSAPPARAPPGACTRLGRLRGLARRAGGREPGPQLASVSAPPSAAHPPFGPSVSATNRAPGRRNSFLLFSGRRGELPGPGTREAGASAARRRQKRRPERGGRATGPEAGVRALAPAFPAAAASRPARSPPSSAAGVWEASPWRPELPGGCKTSRPAARLAAETHLSVSRAAASPPPPPAAILQPCHSPSAGPSIWAFPSPLFFPLIPSFLIGPLRLSSPRTAWSCDC